MTIGEDRAVQLDLAAPLPLTLKNSCYGSDGDRLVVAGGYDPANEARSSAVMALEGLDTAWRNVSAKMQHARNVPAGVLVGDTLVCLGGFDGVGGCPLVGEAVRLCMVGFSMCNLYY